jgi:hypothetical protein
LRSLRTGRSPQATSLPLRNRRRNARRTGLLPPGQAVQARTEKLGNPSYDRTMRGAAPGWGCAGIQRGRRRPQADQPSRHPRTRSRLVAGDIGSAGSTWSCSPIKLRLVIASLDTAQRPASTDGRMIGGAAPALGRSMNGRGLQEENRQLLERIKEREPETVRRGTPMRLATRRSSHAWHRGHDRRTEHGSSVGPEQD